MARGAGRSLRGTARRGGETPPPAPPRPAPASARPPAGREPRHAESRREPPRCAPRGRGAPSARRGWAGTGAASGDPALPLGPASGDGLARPRHRPDVGGAGRADPPAGSRGGAAWGAPGRRRRCDPRGARPAPPARSQRRAPLAARPPGGEGREGEGRDGGASRSSRSSPGTPAAGGTAPAPPSPAESLRVPPKVRPAESGTVGDASHCPVHLPPETASSLHVSIPLPAAGRPLRDARTESRSRRAELPGAAATADFCRRGPGKAPRRQPGHLRAFPAASSGSPRPVSAAQRRAGQHRGCILLLSTSKCDPSPVHPSLVFPKAGRVCQVKGEPWQEMPLAEFRLGYSTVFCSFPA